jgi:hypothetical protein
MPITPVLGAAALFIVTLGWALDARATADGAGRATAPLPPASVPDLSRAMRSMWQRLVQQADPAGLPFAIVDKQAALMAIYRADGHLAGVSRVLLGQQRGDDSLPGVGERTQQGRLRPEDMTTPAGRFVAQPGVNQTGERVVWVDHAAALAIHRLRKGPSEADRARRLASPDPQDKRASAGCIVVPVVFYEAVVEPVLGRARAVVYVIPEAGLGALAAPVELHARRAAGGR